MRQSTQIIRQWQPTTQEGEELRFEMCKGGYFSDKEEYGLKVVGKTAQDNLSGKNLLNETLLYDINNFDISYSSAGFAFFSIPVKAGVAVTISTGAIKQQKDYYLVFGTSATFPMKNAYWINHKTMGMYRTTVTIPADKNSGLVVIGFSNTMTNIKACLEDRSYIQVEYGTTATSYEPYCGGAPSPNPEYPQEIQCVKQGTRVQVEPIEITVPCDLYEGDVWYPMSGRVVKRNRKYVFDGTEAFKTSYASRMYASTTHLFSDVAQNEQDGIQFFTHFKNIFLAASDSRTGTAFVSDKGNVCIGYDNNIGGIDNFKLFLAEQYAAGTPVYMVYPIELPIIEQYDPQPVFAPHGTAIVRQEPVDLAAKLSATMLVKKGGGEI